MKKRVVVLLTMIFAFMSIVALAENNYPCNGMLLKTSNVRKKASQKSNLLGELKKGKTVTVLDSVDVNGTTWYQVEFGKKIGYVRGDLIDVSGQGTVTDDSNDVVKESASENMQSDGITFRNIPWYSTKAATEQLLFSEGGRIGGWSSSDNQVFRISATDYSSAWMGSDAVENGGYKGWYRGLSVAGYTPSETYACYVFPIENGKIVHDKEQAQLYFGWYTFERSDFSDHESIYKDLKTKLTSTYGKGKEKTKKYNTTMTWTDKKKNQIRLLIDDDKTYVTLGYMAAGADKKLDDMDNALKKEAATEEQSTREKNKNNTTGL